MTQENLLRKLRAILEMSRRGTKNEKIIAAEKLHLFLAKHNLDISDIDTENKDEYWFSYRTKFEKRLLFQIEYMITNDTEGIYYKSVGKRELGFRLTRVEHIEMDRLYKFWRNELVNEFERCFNAFIQANKIFGDSVENMDIDAGELRSIMEMARTIEPKRPYRQLARGSNN